MDSPGSNTRIPECTNAYTDASAGTSHLGDVGRSNVLQLVRLRKSRRRKEERKAKERDRTEGESASEEEAGRVG